MQRASNSMGLLGAAARGLTGIQVRFELPFNIWCDGCHKHIGQGGSTAAEPCAYHARRALQCGKDAHWHVYELSDMELSHAMPSVLALD